MERHGESGPLAGRTESELPPSSLVAGARITEICVLSLICIQAEAKRVTSTPDDH